ncbi:MAG: class I SAM-dependent methyltransferase [Micavibrio sp.]
MGFININCVLCNAEGPASPVAHQVKGDPHGKLRVVACANCGHTQLNPPQYDLEFYDEDGQVENVKKFYGTPSEVIYRHAFIEARRRTERFVTSGPPLDGDMADGARKKILDVGGGYGFFGAHVVQQHPCADVVVLEPSARRLEMGREKMHENGVLPDVGAERLDLRIGLLDDDFARAHAGRFDLVTLWHVLEHVPDPVGLLRLASQVVKPGGTVCVEVPNLNDDLMRRSPAFRDRWFMVEHISYFSPAILAMAAKRALPGAEVEVYGYQRYGLFNYMHWISFNAPQGANPDMFEGKDRWWLEASWRATREQTLCSDAIYMTMTRSL